MLKLKKTPKLMNQTSCIKLEQFLVFLSSCNSSRNCVWLHHRMTCPWNDYKLRMGHFLRNEKLKQQNKSDISENYI